MSGSLGTKKSTGAVLQRPILPLHYDLERDVDKLLAALVRGGPLYCVGANLLSPWQASLLTRSQSLPRQLSLFLPDTGYPGRSWLMEDFRAAWGRGINGSKHPGSKKEFKGIFVSAAICRSGDFNPTEKLFLGEIDSLSKYSQCRASNAHLGKRIGLSKSAADHMAADLTKRGAIVRLVFNGKVLRRIVRPDLSDKPTRNQRYIKEYERISSSRVAKFGNPQSC
jgi:hypothetical protein